MPPGVHTVSDFLLEYKHVCADQQREFQSLIHDHLGAGWSVTSVPLFLDARKCLKLSRPHQQPQPRRLLPNDTGGHGHDL